jgi:antitoxin Phd
VSAASRSVNPGAESPEDLGDAPRVSASDAKNSFGRILDRVAREGRVAITKHDEPFAMLISMDQYRALVETGKRSVSTLSDEFDALYKRLQDPGAKAAMQRAFSMTPAELGRAAARRPSAGGMASREAEAAPRGAGKRAHRRRV